MSKEQLEKERWDIAKIMADNFHINGEGWDESDFEWTAHCLQMAGYHRQSEWISVDERLPDGRGRFLVYVERTHCAGVLFVNYTPNYTFGEKSLMGRAVWFLYDGEWGDYEIEGVTHWMPLPEAPKMKGGEE